MPDPDPTASRVGRALVAALATVALLSLGFSLVLPLATITYAEDQSVTETVGTLWQEGIDHGFTDGGGAPTVTYAFVLLVITLSAVVAMLSCAVLMGGPLGPRGARAVRASSIVLLVGAAWMAFRPVRLAELAGEWNERGVPATAGAGVWWLLAGAVAFAALTVPTAVRELWREDPA